MRSRPPAPVTSAQPCRWALLVVLAAATMVLPPVEYRAGANLAHAHAGVQLWLDAARDAVDHHHLDEQAVFIAAPTTVPSPAVESAAGPDTPQWTSLSPVVERVARAVAFGSLFGALVMTGVILPPTATAPLRGRRTRPAFPPPRGHARMTSAM